MLTEAERFENRRQLEALAAEICTMAGHINAANYRFLNLIAEFDRREGWADNVTRSCAHWFNWKCGIELGAAREKVRTAHALATAAEDCCRNGERRAQLLESTCDHAGRDASDGGNVAGIALHGTATHVGNYRAVFPSSAWRPKNCRARSSRIRIAR